MVLWLLGAALIFMEDGANHITMVRKKVQIG
jgi:hypothetical protein